MYCWDRQSSSRCPWSLIRTRRHFPFNSLQNLTSSATLTLCFMEYFESAFPPFFIIWAFSGEKSWMSDCLRVYCRCLCFLLTLYPGVHSVSQPLWERGMKSNAFFSLHLFFWKLTQLDFPHNYSAGCSCLLATKKWCYKHISQRQTCFHASSLARQLSPATSFLGFTKGVMKQEVESRQFLKHHLGPWAFEGNVWFCTLHEGIFIWHVDVSYTKYYAQSSAGSNYFFLLYPRQGLAFLTFY